MRKSKQKPIKLQPGHFYRSRDGEVWCCFRIEVNKPEHAVADCVRTRDARIEYFFRDGRYDSAGLREHCLVVECTPTGRSLTARPTLDPFTSEERGRIKALQALNEAPNKIDRPMHSVRVTGLKGHCAECNAKPGETCRGPRRRSDGPTIADEDASRMQMFEGSVDETPYGGEDGEP